MQYNKYFDSMLANTLASGKILCRLSETIEGREAENLFEDRPTALRFCENRNNILPGALTFLLVLSELREIGFALVVSFLGQAKKESIKIQIKSSPHQFNCTFELRNVGLLLYNNQIYQTVMLKYLFLNY
ncbi:MAG: hypothetical protein U0W24_14645 [Bacteroidales bacterium]